MPGLVLSVLLLAALTTATPAAAASHGVAPALPQDTLHARLRRPAGVTVDAMGRVWVADEERHALLRFADDGAWLDETGSLGSEAGRFRRPGALATLGSLGVAVLDRENFRVVAYDQQGRLLGTIVDWRDPASEQRLGRVDPVALAADGGGALLVGDRDRERMIEYDFRGELLGERGGLGTAAGGFRGLAALAIGPGGERVVLERTTGHDRRRRAADVPASSRLQWWDATGRFVRVSSVAWSRPGDAELALAVSPRGRVAASNSISGEVVVLDDSGAEIARVAGLSHPVALAFTRTGSDLWVAEAGAARVRRVRLAPVDGR